MRTASIVLLIVSIVLAMTAGVIAYGALTSGDYSPDYEYMDMVPLSDFGDPDEMTGCCEVVDFMGTPYVRMTGVGEINAVCGSETKTYMVGKAHLDLFLFTGQSNAYYYSSPDQYDGESPLPPGVAFYLGTEDVPSGSEGRAATALAGSSTLAESSFVDITALDGSVRVAGSYPELMRGYWEATGHRMLVVNSGISAHSISSFCSDSGDCSKWTVNVLDKTKNLAEDVCELNPVAVLWSHGETDYTQTADWYKTRLEAVANKFYDGTYGISFPNMITTLPKCPRAESPTTVALAQMEYAAEDPNFIIASTLPTVLPNSVSGHPDDLFHYTQQVYDWMGEAFSKAATRIVCDVIVAEKVVYCPSLGEVESLPRMVTAYGVSGAKVLFPVLWDDVPTEPGTYTITGELRPPHSNGLADCPTTTAIVTVV